MDPQVVLRELGLGAGEAQVYLALLQLGPSSVLSIARHTNLKRPTIYLLLDVLTSKGFVALVPKERKKLFIALSPDKLRDEQERKMYLVQKTLPSLMALYQTQSGKPTVQLYEGNEGILNVYREITTQPNTNEVLSFFSLEAIPKEFHHGSYDLFIQLFKNGKVSGRDLVSIKSVDHFYLERLRRLKNYEVRLLDQNYKFFTDNIIYGDSVAMFSFKKRFALVVKSADVAVSLRALFESAWKSATKI